MVRIKAGIASKVIVVFRHLVTDYYVLKRRGAAQPKINRVTLRVMEKKIEHVLSTIVVLFLMLKKSCTSHNPQKG